jgi:hypothetical protein
MGMLYGVPTSISMSGQLADELVEGANTFMGPFIDPRDFIAEGVGAASKKQTERLQNEVRKHQEKERAEPKPRTRPPRQEGETESKRQLRAATEAWVQESQHGATSSIKASSLASSSVTGSRASPGRHATDPPSTYTMTAEERAREEAILMSEEERAREEALLMSEEERAREEALLLSEEMKAASQAEASERSRQEDFLQQAYEVERAAEDEISYHGSSRHERTIGADPSDADAFWNYNGSRR